MVRARGPWLLFLALLALAAAFGSIERTHGRRLDVADTPLAPLQVPRDMTLTGALTGRLSGL